MRAPVHAHAGTWACRDRRVALHSRPLLMGILNVTPDSFSDGGLHSQVDLAIAHARHMQAQGADIIDIGGESTRPGAQPVSAAVECARVLPVIEGLMAENGPLISIDTTKAEVARRALQAGACIVNDVSAARSDPAMADLVAQTGAGIVVMHMQGEPRTMQENPRYGDVVEDVLAFLLGRAEALERHGVKHEQIMIDPGIGFGKTAEHNIALLAHLERFCDGPYPVLVGLSRKRFLATITTREVGDRLAGSLAAAMVCAQKGVAVMRVHDVPQTYDVFRVLKALRQGA
ncbi:MAG: dihydropteroate synthase [Verrucomicrobia bacterium]|nr:dihydropteroate synthase [Verrucomicrobiota bacterium]